jgi:serine/threonine-protein kinase
MVNSDTALGPYRLIRRIGAGGMAEVFLAEKTGAAGFSRHMAVKTILAGGAPQESIGLFLDEARVASALQHPAIVQTLDLGFENDTLFIAMEYVPGPALSRVIQELKTTGRPPLAPHQVAYVGARVASALDFAHRRVTTPLGQPLALVHRDVSPQNILVSRQGLVKLMDFGVARASIQMHKTRTGQVRGKAAYMAPEQVRAQPLDGRTDMFALGLVLYEALTAWRPYQRTNEINSMRAIISEDVPPLRDRNPAVPEALAEVIHRAIRRPIQERFAHCGELEEALLAHLGGHTPSAIERELEALIDKVFGQERYADGSPEVEAWQPTMASLTSPVTPGSKLPMTPTIANMLGPATPATPSVRTLAPRDDGRVASDPSFDSAPLVQGVVGTPPSSAQFPGIAPGYGAPGESTPSFATSGYGAPALPPNYLTPGYGNAGYVTPSGAHGALPGTPPAQNTPFGVTSPSTIIDSPRAARWVWGLAGLLIVLSAGVLLQSLSKRDGGDGVEPMPPSTALEVAASPAPNVGAQVPAPPPSAANEGAPTEPTSSAAPEPPPGTSPAPSAPEPARAGSTSARVDTARASARPTPRPIQTPRADGPRPIEEPRSNAEAARASLPSAADATRHARALAARARTAGNDALASTLTDLSVRILERDAVTDADVAKLREAERTLGAP